MEPLGIAKSKIPDKAVAGIPDALVTVQIHLLILHRPPQTLDKDIVKDPSATVHAYPHPAASSLSVNSMLVN